MNNKIRNFKTPHTYAIIFFVVIISRILTFLVPAGKFSVHDIEYEDANGEIQTRSVLEEDTFRYEYDLDSNFIDENLPKLSKDKAFLEENEVDQKGLEDLLAKNDLTKENLDKVGLTDDVLYNEFGDKIYDKNNKLHKTAKIWGTDDTGGFGFLNYIFEGLVTGDKYGSAVGIVALILVVGGSFGILMDTGAIDAGIFSFINKSKGMERFALPVLYFMFSFFGATFGMSEEVIPFAMIVVPFVIALGYDSLVAVTVTFVASQAGNAVSWMNPFGVAIAQGIAGVPILSGAGFRIGMFVVITSLGAAYMMVYAERIRKNPSSSVVYETDRHVRKNFENSDQKVEFLLGHKIILLEVLLGLVWIIWGVMAKEYYIPEIASQFFVIGLISGITALVFKINNTSINSIAQSFQNGVKDLAATAVVVGMAKGILLVLGGSDPNTFSALNTILYSVGNALSGVSNYLAAIGMYIFQSLFNLVVTSNSGQAALTMPIMAPLSDIVGLSRQIAVLAFQMGSGFMDAFTPVSASLIGVLAVANIDWVKWAKYQWKMQLFFFILGCITLIIAVAINLQ